MSGIGYLHTHNYSSLRFSLLAQLILHPLFRKAHAVGRNRLNLCHVAEPPLNLPDCSQLKPEEGRSRRGWKQVCGHNDSNLCVYACTCSFSRWGKKNSRLDLPNTVNMFNSRTTPKRITGATLCILCKHRAF